MRTCLKAVQFLDIEEKFEIWYEMLRYLPQDSKKQYFEPVLLWVQKSNAIALAYANLSAVIFLIIEKFCFPQKFSSFFLCILQKFKKVFESHLSAENTDDDDDAVVSCESQQSGVCILNVASDCIWDCNLKHVCFTSIRFWKYLDQIPL